MRALWETMGAVQAGIKLRQDEARKDLAECDRQRTDLVQAAQHAMDDSDEQAYEKAQTELEQLTQAERVLREVVGDDETPQGGPSTPD